MKIAIISPFPVPLALGGAENLWWGLQNHINTQTEHRCDIVSIVSPESNFWDLVTSYQTFAKLDLSAYDCVISGKYPAWMVEHDNHVCYMLHRLRGLYDTYTPNVASDALLQLPKVRSFAQWLRDGIASPDPGQIGELFDRLATLRDSDVPGELFALPGAFSRAVVHFLDNAALSPLRVKRYSAISKTVAQRKAYFPPGAMVDVLYPPPHRDDFYTDEQRYFFTSSRLDGPKRVDLLIEAAKRMRADTPLKIAGTGPQEAALRALAGDTQRVEFLGYVPDQALPQLYANALAVPFVPAQEDYGLITIEAMKSAKPVVTLSDSGGPCEFVTSGETGFVCDPAPQNLADALDALADDPAGAEKMGLAAQELVAPITWKAVFDGLMERPGTSAVAASMVRPKLTVATTFRVYPPMNGGQSRIFHLYRNMARVFDIDIVSLAEPSDSYSETEIAPGVVEIAVPKSDTHRAYDDAIAKLASGKPVNDITASVLLPLTPAYIEALELSALTSEAVIASHPYPLGAIKAAAPGKPVWYEAQDVELTLKTAVLGADPALAALLKEVETSEHECWAKSDVVFACAQRDLDEFETLYGPTRASLVEVPNGVSLDDVVFTSQDKRHALQMDAGVSEQTTAIFIGSWHGPNLEAVEMILDQAAQCPQTRFLVAGSVCLPFGDHHVPSNVDLLGAVDMETRDALLAFADVALNPMRSGTGTNLKMLDYMAAGIPVISTQFGARGLVIEPSKHYITMPGDDLISGLNAFAKLDDEARRSLVVQARARVESLYSWQGIADAFLERLAKDMNMGNMHVGK